MGVDEGRGLGLKDEEEDPMITVVACCGVPPAIQTPPGRAVRPGRSMHLTLAQHCQRCRIARNIPETGHRILDHWNWDTLIGSSWTGPAKKGC